MKIITLWCQVNSGARLVYAVQILAKTNTIGHGILHACIHTAFLIFVGIVLYHAQRQVFLTKAGANLKNIIVQVYFLNKDNSDHLDLKLPASTKVTSTVVELKEPLSPSWKKVIHEPMQILHSLNYLACNVDDAHYHSSFSL